MRHALATETMYRLAGYAFALGQPLRLLRDPQMLHSHLTTPHSVALILQLLGNDAEDSAQRLLAGSGIRLSDLQNPDPVTHRDMRERCSQLNSEFVQRQALITRCRRVLNELRFKRARQLLEQHELPIQQIGELMGYSETASFRHAFQRWSGLSPSRFRG